MLVCPKWLRVSADANNLVFELKDLDESFSEIFQALNGNLADENVAEIPYEAIAWHGWVKQATGDTPSWKGHIHDGVSARRLAAGYVGRADVPYDGSLGVLLHPEHEGVFGWQPTQSYVIHPFGFADGVPEDITVTSLGRTYLVCGKFGFAPGAGSVPSLDETYREQAAAYVRRAMVSVPFDITELDGPLTNPVVVATLRAEMTTDSFPERGLPFQDSDSPEDRFWGMDISNIQLFPVTGEGEVGGTGTFLRGYMLMFEVVLPGPDHPITEGVGQWWVDWMLLARVSQGAHPVFSYAGGEG